MADNRIRGRGRHERKEENTIQKRWRFLKHAAGWSAGGTAAAAADIGHLAVGARIAGDTHTLVFVNVVHTRAAVLTRGGGALIDVEGAGERQQIGGILREARSACVTGRSRQRHCNQRDAEQVHRNGRALAAERAVHRAAEARRERVAGQAVGYQIQALCVDHCGGGMHREEEEQEAEDADRARRTAATIRHRGYWRHTHAHAHTSNEESVYRMIKSDSQIRSVDISEFKLYILQIRIEAAVRPLALFTRRRAVYTHGLLIVCRCVIH